MVVTMVVVMMVMKRMMFDSGVDDNGNKEVTMTIVTMVALKRATRMMI